MLIVRSRNGVPIRLTEERWRHIVVRHPEMDDLREAVLETLAGPDMKGKETLESYWRSGCIQRRLWARSS